MGNEVSVGKPTSRRYLGQEKERAVHLMRHLHAELGTDHGTVKRVAEQLGIGVALVFSIPRSQRAVMHTE